MQNSSRNKTAVADGISLTTASWRIPFRSIEPLVWGTDCIIILASSILSGLAYHSWFVGGGGDLETFLAVGLLVAVNFTTVLAARGSYKPLPTQGSGYGLAHRLFASACRGFLAQGRCDAFARRDRDVPGCWFNVADRLARIIGLLSNQGLCTWKLRGAACPGNRRG